MQMTWKSIDYLLLPLRNRSMCNIGMKIEIGEEDNDGDAVGDAGEMCPHWKVAPIKDGLAGVYHPDKKLKLQQ